MREPIVGRADSGADLLRGYFAPLPGQQLNRDAGIDGITAGLILVDVGVLMADDLLQTAAVHAEGYLVGHGARGAEKGRLVAE